MGVGYFRRGAKEADELILELVRIADAVRGDANKHMAHEEQEVLPLLEAHLCAAEQRAMVWRTLRAMPLRLLERVMPWVAGKLLRVCCWLCGTACCDDNQSRRMQTLPGVSTKERLQERKVYAVRRHGKRVTNEGPVTLMQAAQSPFCPGAAYTGLYASGKLSYAEAAEL